MKTKNSCDCGTVAFGGVNTIDDLNVVIDRVKTAQEVLATYTQEYLRRWLWRPTMHVFPWPRWP